MTQACVESKDSMNGFPLAQLEIHFRRTRFATSSRRGPVIDCTSSLARNLRARAAPINGAHCLMLNDDRAHPSVDEIPYRHVDQQHDDQRCRRKRDERDRNRPPPRSRTETGVPPPPFNRAGTPQPPDVVALRILQPVQREPSPLAHPMSFRKRSLSTSNVSRSSPSGALRSRW